MPDIGRCELLDEIGSGGFGRVYRARHRQLGVVRAVKVAIHEDYVRRLREEGKALARLRHKNIVTIHDMDADHDPAYIEMDYVDGGSLRDLVKQGPVPLERALEIMEGILEALREAHGRGIIHRDIKPANILLDSEGTARVSDFGLARVATGDSGSAVVGSVSGDGSRSQVSEGLVGTLEYMSPEQRHPELLGEGRLDGRSDLYSAGLVFYEMVTGRFSAGATEAPSVVRKGIPVWVDGFWRRLVEYQRERRYPSALHALKALRERTAAKEEVGPRPPEPLRPVAAPIPTWMWWLYGALLVMAFLSYPMLWFLGVAGAVAGVVLYGQSKSNWTYLAWGGGCLVVCIVLAGATSGLRRGHAAPPPSLPPVNQVVPKKPPEVREIVKPPVQNLTEEREYARMLTAMAFAATAPEEGLRKCSDARAAWNTVLGKAPGDDEALRNITAIDKRVVDISGGKVPEPGPTPSPTPSPTPGPVTGRRGGGGRIRGGAGGGRMGTQRTRGGSGTGTIVPVLPPQEIPQGPATLSFSYAGTQFTATLPQSWSGMQQIRVSGGRLPRDRLVEVRVDGRRVGGGGDVPGSVSINLGSVAYGTHTLWIGLTDAGGTAEPGASASCPFTGGGG